MEELVGELGDLEEFSKEVNDHIKKGWVLHRNTFANGDYYYQAMVKYV